MYGVDQVVQSESRLFRVSTKEELIESLFDEQGEVPSEGTAGKGLLRSHDLDLLCAAIV